MYLADANINHHYNVELDWNVFLSRNWALRSKLSHQK